MKRRALHLIVLAAALATGCKEAGRSIVQADISAAAGVTGLTSVDLIATQGADGGAELGRQSFTWAPGPSGSIEVGLFLPASVKGSVQIYADGYGTTTLPIAVSASMSVTVTAGQNTPVVSLVLEPAPPGNSDGGNPPPVDAGADAPPVDAGADKPPVDAGPDAAAGRSWSAGGGQAETNSDEDDENPQIAIAASGDAVVVWEHGSAIWFNRYDAQTGTWGTAGPVGNADGVVPQVALDDAGVATVLWAGPDDNRGIWASSSNGSGGWNPAVQLSTGSANGLPLEETLAVGGDGTAIAAWSENNDNNQINQFIVWVSSRPAGGTWTAAQPIMDASDSFNRSPRAAMDGAGHGFLVWDQPPPEPSDDPDSVWISTFTGGSFGAPQTLEDYTAGDAQLGNVVMNPGGGAMAVWLQNYDDHQEVWGRQYVSGAWTPPQSIATASFIDISQAPGLAVNAAGAATAVWSQASLTGGYNVHASRYHAGAQPTWDPSLTLETDDQSQGDSGDFPAAQVGLDGAGNSIVVWRKQTSTGRAGLTLWGGSIDPTGALGARLRIDDNGTDGVFGNQLAVADSGIAIAVWYNGGTSELVWSAVWR